MKNRMGSFAQLQQKHIDVVGKDASWFSRFNMRFFDTRGVTPFPTKHGYVFSYENWFKPSRGDAYPVYKFALLRSDGVIVNPNLPVTLYLSRGNRDKLVQDWVKALNSAYSEYCIVCRELTSKKFDYYGSGVERFYCGCEDN